MTRFFKHLLIFFFSSLVTDMKVRIVWLFTSLFSFFIHCILNTIQNENKLTFCLQKTLNYTSHITARQSSSNIRTSHILLTVKTHGGAITSLTNIAAKCCRRAKCSLQLCPFIFHSLTTVWSFWLAASQGSKKKKKKGLYSHSSDQINFFDLLANHK